jgi:hypothetical protein
MLRGQDPQPRFPQKGVDGQIFYYYAMELVEGRSLTDDIAANKNGMPAKRAAAGHFRKAVELNVPGETWPLFEAQLRLSELRQ